MSEVLIGNSTPDFFDKCFDENLKERRLILNEEITQDIIEKIVLQIIKFNKEDIGKSILDRKPIILYINSLGGEVANGCMILDIIKTSKTPVYGVALAYTYSMGALILLATHKRYAFDNSTILIHDGSMGVSTSGSKFKDVAKFYDNMNERIKKFVLSRTNMTSEFYDSKYEKEFYLYADEGKEHGIIDSIIGIDCELDEIL